MRPNRPVDTSDRAARSSVVGSGSGTTATVTRVGSAIIQKSGAPLRTHEHALAAATSGALLGASLLGARFPRLVAWPLATVGGLFGGLGIVRAARSALSDGASGLSAAPERATERIGKATNREEGSEP